MRKRTTIAILVLLIVLLLILVLLRCPKQQQAVSPKLPVPPDPQKILAVEKDIPHKLAACDFSPQTPADLTAAITAADSTRDQTICLNPAVTYAGNFELNKNNGSNYTTLRSAQTAQLPINTRVKPADAPKLAKVVSPNPRPALWVRPYASGYRFIGLDVSSTGDNGVLVKLGTNNSKPELGPTQTTPEQIPTRVMIDRNWIHGPNKTAKTSDGIEVDANYVAIVNNYIEEFHDGSGDCQGIGVFNGGGPLIIRNNFIYGAGENIMFGGVIPAMVIVPSDVLIEGNWIWKDPTRRTGVDASKNLLEWKTGRRMLVRGNTIQNHWSGVQSQYFAIVAKTANQGSVCSATRTGYYNQTADIEFAFNKVIDIDQFLAIGRAAACDKIDHGTETIYVHDNLIINIGQWHKQDGAPKIVQWSYPVQDGAEKLYPLNITVVHNTVTQPVGFSVNSLRYEHLETQGNYVRDHVSHSNIFPGKWFVAGTYNNETIINDRFRNVLAARNNVYVSSAPAAFASAPNYARTSYAGLFVDPARGNFRVAPAVAGQYPGTDGKVAGADIDAVEKCISGSTENWGGCEGKPVPIPPSEPLAVTLAANGTGEITVKADTPVTLAWIPTSASACQAGASTDEANAIWAGAKNAKGGSQTIRPQSTADYTIVCTNPQGDEAAAQVTVQVIQPERCQWPPL